MSVKNIEKSILVRAKVVRTYGTPLIVGHRYSGKQKIDYRLLTQKPSQLSYKIPAIAKTLLYSNSRVGYITAVANQGDFCPKKNDF